MNIQSDASANHVELEVFVSTYQSFATAIMESLPQYFVRNGPDQAIKIIRMISNQFATKCLNHENNRHVVADAFLD